MSTMLQLIVQLVADADADADADAGASENGFGGDGGIAGEGDQ